MTLTSLRIIQQNFLKELQDANDGKENSLPYIVNEIPQNPLVKNNDAFEVLVVGGSVCKKAILVKSNKGLTIIKMGSIKQPPFKKASDFLEFIKKNLEKNIDILALNLAYPLKPVFTNKKLDGILIRGAKENTFDGLIGKKVADVIEKYIFQKRGKRINVSLANDTICLLLSGLTKYSYKSLAAGIVGTGLNFAIFLDEKRLVNLESANFNKFPQTKEGKIIDANSTSPKKALFEKEVAGAYLYKHFNLIIKNKNIDFSPINSTEELNLLCHPEFISGTNKMLKLVQHDKIKIPGIAKELLKRSAQLVACQIAGITEFKKSNMIFVMEGSLFWKGNKYKKTVEETVRKLAPKFKVKFVEIKDSNIFGASKLIS